MEAEKYLKYIVQEIHSTVFATVDSKGRPVTCAIDIMDYDESGLYLKFTRGRENGLISQKSLWSGPLLPLVERLGLKAAIL
ncbi:pyridoxine/pyridoxamine 5'-phosphate oxidase [Catenibacillus scindens]|uniref:Pyridoxine/pyridoxamine 5'-phosphate oxidase n=1 Tax=Catenibacillus scindens TaxID=673271 RepID=A0A7W8M4S1_9FIRM|nr:pyridoxine/pyridoxamine 5'-phosphate oxidase [Catenibacillus scindens]